MSLSSTTADTQDPGTPSEVACCFTKLVGTHSTECLRELKGMSGPGEACEWESVCCACLDGLCHKWKFHSSPPPVGKKQTRMREEQGTVGLVNSEQASKGELGKKRGQSERDLSAHT